MDKPLFPTLTIELFRKMSDLLFNETGIKLKEHKRYLMVNRLSKMVGDNKPYADFEAYYRDLLTDKTGKMLTEFINVLTTNFSYFFREEIHFGILKKYLRENAGKEPYIRIWSAACSTGEEPYSIAISCIQSLPFISQKDTKILATDISTKVLDIASAGNYHYTKVRGHIEDKELRTYFIFDKESNSFQVKPEVKAWIAFRYLNIMEEFPFKKKWDVVFLRNILIYFENREKEWIINKISGFLKPGGLLILGLSESMVGINHSLAPLRNSVFLRQ